VHVLTAPLAPEAARAAVSSAAVMSLDAAARVLTQNSDARRNRRPQVNPQVAVADYSGVKGDVDTSPQNRPAVSRCQDTHFMPDSWKEPVGMLEARDPQKAAGRMTEPPVWLPVATARSQRRPQPPSPRMSRLGCG